MLKLKHNDLQKKSTIMVDLNRLIKYTIRILTY